MSTTTIDLIERWTTRGSDPTECVKIHITHGGVGWALTEFQQTWIVHRACHEVGRYFEDELHPLLAAWGLPSVDDLWDHVEAHRAGMSVEEYREEQAEYLAEMQEPITDPVDPAEL
jgi:hypothetical protein